MQKQVPKARRNSNIILWHPSGVRPPEGAPPGGRSPFTLNDHRLPSTNPPGWRKSEFVFARAQRRGFLEKGTPFIGLGSARRPLAVFPDVSGANTFDHLAFCHRQQNKAQIDRRDSAGAS
jgi:hypothetical protein